MSEATETKEMTETTELTGVHSSPPYLQAFGALAVLTVIEIIVGSFESTTPVLTLLGVLALAKAAIVAAVFMHVAYEKDVRQIIFICFIVPLIGVLLLTAVLSLDYRF